MTMLAVGATSYLVGLGVGVYVMALCAIGKGN